MWEAIVQCGVFVAWKITSFYLFPHILNVVITPSKGVVLQDLREVYCEGSMDIARLYLR